MPSNGPPHERRCLATGGCDVSDGLTHIDEHGRASMVDVTGKAVTFRHALARCRIVGLEAAQSLVRDPEHAETLAAGRIAGILGGKSTADLIPLCHPIPLTDIDVEIHLEGSTVEIVAVAETVSRTGVEMEALTACALAGLSVLGALLHEHPEARMEDLTLWRKSGGRSGTWERDDTGMRSTSPGNAVPADGPELGTSASPSVLEGE